MPVENSSTSHRRTQSSSYLTSPNWSTMLCRVLSLRPLFIYFVFIFCQFTTGWCICLQSSEKLTTIWIFFVAGNLHSLWKCSCQNIFQKLFFTKCIHCVKGLEGLNSCACWGKGRTFYFCWSEDSAKIKWHNRNIIKGKQRWLLSVLRVKAVLFWYLH